MLKRTILISALVFSISNATLASNAYIGIGVGGSNFNDDMTVMNANMDLGKTGFIGGVYAGVVGKFKHNFNLGLEVFGNASPIQIKVSNQNLDEDEGDSSESARINDRYSYGIRLLPGFSVTPSTSIYALVGFVHAYFKLALDDSNDGNASKVFNPNGYQIGLGGVTNITKNIALRGDIIYSGYQNKTFVSMKNQFNSFDGIVSVLYQFT